MRNFSADGQSLTIREFSIEPDLPVFLRLVHAIERDQYGAERSTQESLGRMLGWPGMRCWVAALPADPDTLVAYGLLFPQIPERSWVETSVHPDWRRKGLGSRMLAFLLDEARKSGAECVYNEITDTNTTGIAFSSHHGFQIAGDAWALRAAAETNFDRPVWPEGYTVRSFAEVGNIEVLCQANNRGFCDRMGHHENTAGGVKVEELSQWLKKWDPNGIFIAFAPDGTPLGACRAQPGEEEDLVDEPGVAPEHRHLMLQRPMLLAALAWLRQQGRRPVRLESWGDPPETVRLYEQVGFQLVEHAVSMKYDLMETRK